MSSNNAALTAGAVSTVLFVAAYLPMLAKARRTRDLRSYSVGNLAVANLGNLVHTVYIVSLPAGPIWALHGFYLVATGLMLWWWIRWHEGPDAEHQDEAGGAEQDDRPTMRRAESVASGAR